MSIEKEKISSLIYIHIYFLFPKTALSDFSKKVGKHSLLSSQIKNTRSLPAILNTGYISGVPEDGLKWVEFQRFFITTPIFPCPGYLLKEQSKYGCERMLWRELNLVNLKSTNFKLRNYLGLSRYISAIARALKSR